MVSKVEKLWNLYDVSNELFDSSNKLKEEIEKLHSNYDSKKLDREITDVGNTSLIASFIESSIVSSETEAIENSNRIASSQLEAFRKQEVQLRRNFRRFSTWYLTKKSAENAVHKSTPIAYKSENEQKADNYPLVANSFFKWLFLGLLMILVIGPAVWVYKLIKKLSNLILDLGIVDTIIGIAAGVLSVPLWWSLVAELSYQHAKIFWTIVITVPLVSIVFLIVQIILSHQAMKNEADKFLAVLYPDEYIEKCRNALMSDFYKNKKQWKKDLELFKSGEKPESLNEFIEHYRRMNEDADKELETLSNTISEIEAKKNDIDEKLDEISKEIEECKKLVGENIPFDDKNYNDGVLTNYVCFKKAGYVIRRHMIAPTVCIYESNTAAGIQKELSELTADLYSGLVCENHFSLIDYYMIDYETGGGFLSGGDARKLVELNLLHVANDNRSKEALYQKLKTQKDRIVGSGGTGDIATINPARINDGDVPFKYFVVIHYGKEARSITNDMLQLYMSSSKFGFLPVFVMSENEYNEIMSNDSDVVRNIISECQPLRLEYV